MAMPHCSYRVGVAAFLPLLPALAFSARPSTGDRLTRLEAISGWQMVAIPGEAPVGKNGVTGRTRSLHQTDMWDTKTLAGWRAIGDAEYTVEDGAIVGEALKGGHSFLVTDKQYGDFVLDVDLQNEKPGNSGIQVRSHVNDKGAVYGYQIEIDPSERAWSGGLYDEGRRGWLEDLSKNAAARKAFRPGEWNHYHIECIGPWIRASVNEIPTADRFDPLDQSGFIGLQVHSGTNTKVRWTNLKLADLGLHEWKPLEVHEHKLAVLSPDICLRIKASSACVLWFRCGDATKRDETLVRDCGGGLSERKGGWRLEIAPKDAVKEPVNAATKATVLDADKDAAKDDVDTFVLCDGNHIALFRGGERLARVDDAGLGTACETWLEFSAPPELSILTSAVR